jgi:uncharacterized protein (TIGR02996 family)
MIALPDSYLRAVRELPDDDGPRLVAADWWDEQGASGRAEFVRVQCKLARLEAAHMPLNAPCTCTRTDEDFRRYQAGEYCGACRRRREPIEALRRRERELLAGSRGKWFDFPITWHVGIDPVPVGAHGFQYRRGFFEVAALTAADFLACADALTAACPLRRVRLTTWPEAEWASSNISVRLVGSDCRWSWRSLSELFRGDSRVVNRAMVLQAYLAVEFPGIDFELPTVELQPGSLPPSQLPLTTDNRGSSPRPSWSTRTY